MLVDEFLCCALLYCCTIVHTWWVMGQFLVCGWYYYYCCTATIAVVVHGTEYIMGSLNGLGTSAVVVLTRVYVASPRHTLSAACGSFDYYGRLPP